MYTRFIYTKTKKNIHANLFGFLKDKSTQSQLLKFYNKVHINQEKGVQTDVVYLDFAKAFDCVSHKLLCHKLKMYGFYGRLHVWLENYLNGRCQSVVLDGVESGYMKVLSGVPQGSILTWTPLIFTLHK